MKIKKKIFFESVETITFESRVVQLLIRHLEVATAVEHLTNFRLVVSSRKISICDTDIPERKTFEVLTSA